MPTNYIRDIGEGIQIHLNSNEELTDRTRNVRLAVTVMYDDYMESDPILIAALDQVVGPAHTHLVSLSFQLDTSEIDKRITGFNIYVANNPEEILQLIRWPNNFAEYFFKEFVDVSEDPISISLEDYEETVSAYNITFLAVADETQVNLLDALGRAPSLERERVKARYITRSQRHQSSIVVIDDGERELRLSTYSGGGVHEDENFPPVRVDNLGNPQIVPLEGRGELLGLQAMEGRVYAFRQTEVETIDLHSGVVGLEQADFIAKDSLILTPYGMFWAGHSGIYMFPSGGGGLTMINDSWKNLYDGTLKDSEGDPQITRSIREGIVAGYDPFNIAVWFMLDKIYRFHILSDGLWSVRDAEQARFFLTTEDGKLIIGTADGLLEYPYQKGDLKYHYKVSEDGLSSEGGIPFQMLFNWGSLYNISASVRVHELLIDYRGTHDTDGYFEVRLYANEDTEPWETKRFKFNDRPSPRMISPRGPVEQVRVEVEIPEAQLSGAQELFISKITLGYVADPRFGNN